MYFNKIENPEIFLVTRHHLTASVWFSDFSFYNKLKLLQLDNFV